MRSKITIDVDEQNQPIILINYESSNDVRDKLVKRFLEAFGGISCYARFHFLPHPEGLNVSRQNAVLIPLSPDVLHEHANMIMSTVVDNHLEK
jgi:hypothetical protein